LSESEDYFRDESVFGYENSSGMGGGGGFGGGSFGESMNGGAGFDEGFTSVNESLQVGDVLDMVEEMDVKEDVAQRLESDEDLMFRPKTTV
jgi:hypothetical protein